jgi:N-acetylneuraminate synthase
MANNHWGNVVRGKKLIQDFGAIVRHNSVRAAIKLQFRDVENFIHKKYKGNQDIRYIKKTEATKLSRIEIETLVQEIRKVSCIPMATPFDEKSVDLCAELNLPIIKIASSDVNDWLLLEKIASTKIPVIASSGGANEKQLDDLVAFFEKKQIPLAINHCVSLYPSEDEQLELNQIDYLIERYPEHVIGFSTHEYRSWEASMLISYAKGVRTWERHVDIDHEGVPVSPYCSKPEQIDRWFKSYQKAKEMCGGSNQERRTIPKAETEYLNALVRGIYLRNNINAGFEITNENFPENFYMAVPLLKGQLSVKEVMSGITIKHSLSKDSPLMVDDISGPYGESEYFINEIRHRGL